MPYPPATAGCGRLTRSRTGCSAGCERTSLLPTRGTGATTDGDGPGGEADAASAYDDPRKKSGSDSSVIRETMRRACASTCLRPAKDALGEGTRPIPRERKRWCKDFIARRAMTVGARVSARCARDRSPSRAEMPERGSVHESPGRGLARAGAIH
jgi:hypothetical protein